MGNADSAFDLAVARQLAKPADMRYAEAYRELVEWCTWRDSWSRIDGADHGDGELSLEPLGFHHLSDFAWQYHDPAVAELCCLPTFPGDDQWREWLADIYRMGDQRIYAVMHATLGFVGNVSLIQHGGLGFFYYWLGPDFQGRGLGPRAVALLLAQAEEAWGLECCYAKVYEHNAHSRRALEKLGFEELGIAAVSPNDDEVFYRRGEPAARERIVGELHWLLAAMDSETRAAALLATP
jgi:RimJ/RimL family protein N-acetyltransferase